MPLELPFDFTDLTNYQHPPCMFLLWYISLLFVTAAEKVAELLPEGGIQFPQVGGSTPGASKKTPEKPPPPPSEGTAGPADSGVAAAEAAPKEAPPEAKEAPAEVPPAEASAEEPASTE